MPWSKTPPPPPALRWRSVVNLVNLSTPLGLLVAAAGRARLRPGANGLVLGEGYRLPFPVAGAFTVGNVVVTAGTFEQLQRRCPAVLKHEDRHAWQYAYCLGLPYLVAYTAAMGWSALRTGDRASANVFERQAGLAAGGYVERPIRPLGPVLRGLLLRILFSRAPGSREFPG